MKLEIRIVEGSEGGRRLLEELRGILSSSSTPARWVGNALVVEVPDLEEAGHTLSELVSLTYWTYLDNDTSYGVHGNAIEIAVLGSGGSPVLRFDSHLLDSCSVLDLFDLLDVGIDDEIVYIEDELLTDVKESLGLEACPSFCGDSLCIDLLCDVRHPLELLVCEAPSTRRYRGRYRATLASYSSLKRHVVEGIKRRLSESSLSVHDINTVAELLQSIVRSIEDHFGSVKNFIAELEGVPETELEEPEVAAYLDPELLHAVDTFERLAEALERGNLFLSLMARHQHRERVASYVLTVPLREGLKGQEEESSLVGRRLLA